MARIDDLVAEIGDERVRREVAAEVKKLREEKKFGLVFENHLPELSYLHGASVRAGANVVKRGTKNAEVYRVMSVEDGAARIVRDVEGASEAEQVALPELTVVKRYGEAIYPALLPVESVEKNPSKPYHTIINSDNYHALQLLLYCYEGKFDVIYIDPPYNTGARDWKYNNAYVDSNDQWRHSKWLAMMKKRLVLAKRLLKPNIGVLICTIDDWETHHLQMLLEDIFSERELTNVIIEHNPKGSPSNNFTYSHEYAHYLIPRNQSIIGLATKEKDDVRNLRRAGRASTREERKTMFYPIYVKDGQIIRIGEPPDDSFHPCKRSVLSESGEYEVYPIDDNGKERRWHFGLDSINDELSRISIKQTDDDIQLYVSSSEGRYKTVWTGGDLDAGKYGTTLVKDIVGQEFSFPKSLYATKRCLASVVKTNPDALILDFFAGSGTTMHATALLNAEDNGNRRCILVTNNEVDEKTAKQLNRAGIFAGDAEFERHGICESVTFPRCEYVINGHRDDGTPLPGKYLNGRELAAGFDENLAYFKLDFLDPNEVALGSKFENVLPILWLMAGAQGKLVIRNGKKPFYIPDASPFAVLLKERHFSEFRTALATRPDITHVFLVTDSQEAFREMSADIAGDRETVMLYKNYLDNFRLNTERWNA